MFPSQVRTIGSTDGAIKLIGGTMNDIVGYMLNAPLLAQSESMDLLFMYKNCRNINIYVASIVDNYRGPLSLLLIIYLNVNQINRHSICFYNLV